MANRRLRVLFFGTADFAVPSLVSLVAAGHQILGVVTQPDRPTGRGLQISASPVKQAALSHGLEVLQPRRVRFDKFVERVRQMQPEAIALAAFGQIMPASLLNIPPLGPINVHGSLLPKYRGAAPIQRALMAGESHTGVTTMWMDATLDTGDILMVRSIPIERDDNAGTLLPRLADLGAGLLLETLEGLAAGVIQRQPQDDSRATLAPIITPHDGIMRWRDTASEAHNRIRGVTPRPGAFAAIKGRKVKLWASVPVARETDAQPGTVVGIERKPAGVAVACGDGRVLLVTEAQPENGRRMGAADWARGQRLTAGDRFDSLIDAEDAG